jgi:hypothetical protein
VQWQSSRGNNSNSGSSGDNGNSDNSSSSSNSSNGGNSGRIAQNNSDGKYSSRAADSGRQNNPPKNQRGRVRVERVQRERVVGGEERTGGIMPRERHKVVKEAQAEKGTDWR